MARGRPDRRPGHRASSLRSENATLNRRWSRRAGAIGVSSRAIQTCDHAMVPQAGACEPASGSRHDERGCAMTRRTGREWGSRSTSASRPQAERMGVETLVPPCWERVVPWRASTCSRWLRHSRALVAGGAAVIEATRPCRTRRPAIEPLAEDGTLLFGGGTVLTLSMSGRCQERRCPLRGVPGHGRCGRRALPRARAAAAPGGRHRVRADAGAGRRADARQALPAEAIGGVGLIGALRAVSRRALRADRWDRRLERSGLPPPSGRGGDRR